MSKLIYVLATSAALAVTGIVSIAASAADTSVAGSVFGAGTVGAMHNETRGLATNALAVRNQGGAATAGTVRWIATPDLEARVGAVYGAGTVGAMHIAPNGLATNGGSVRQQGGFATAGAVRWEGVPPTLAAVSDPAAVGAL